MSSEATTIQTRECRRCHYILPMQDFHRSQGTGRRGGYHSWCKECHSEYSADRYAEKTEAKAAGAKKRMGPTPRNLLADEEVARLNRKHYREREGKACAFVGCQTRVRYRSPYKPYCQLHGTKDKRERAIG